MEKLKSCMGLMKKILMKNKKKPLGKSAKCDACQDKTHYYVVISTVGEAMPHIKNKTYDTYKPHTICINCYTRDTWQIKIATKETTTKEKSLKNSKQKGLKQEGNPSVVLLEENFEETLTSKLKGRDGG